MVERIYLTDWSRGRQSHNHKKLYNQIRTFREDGILYLEVKLQGDHTMLCDIQDLKLLQSRTWTAQKDRNTYYCTNRDHKHFHRYLFPEWSCVDHINRDGLDNRRKNLRDGSNGVNYKNRRLQINNTSGINGLRYDQKNKTWSFSWYEQ